MKNPFSYGNVVSGEFFTNREEDLEDLKTNLLKRDQYQPHFAEKRGKIFAGGENTDGNQKKHRGKSGFYRHVFNKFRK